MAQGRKITKIELEIQKLRAKEGNCRSEAFSLEQKAAQLRAQELAYRDAWQAIESAKAADEGSANEG